MLLFCVCVVSFVSRQTLTNPTDKRIFVLATALSKGYTIDALHKLTKIDKWFLTRMKTITDFALQLRANSKAPENLSERLRYEDMLTAKRLGFSDRQVRVFFQ